MGVQGGISTNGGKSQTFIYPIELTNIPVNITAMYNGGSSSINGVTGDANAATINLTQNITTPFSYWIIVTGV